MYFVAYIQVIFCLSDVQLCLQADLGLVTRTRDCYDSRCREPIRERHVSSALQMWQQEVREQKVAEMVHSHCHLNAVLRFLPLTRCCN